MRLKIVFDDDTNKQLKYSGDWTFAQWTELFFSKRYYVLCNNNEIGNMTIDTYKVKYVEII